MSMIPGGGGVGKCMRLRISMRICSTMEGLSRGLYAAVVEVNNFCIKRELGIGS